MLDLKSAIDDLDEPKFSQILNTEIYDADEVLMLLYCAVTCFNSEKAFDILLKRNNYFRVKPEWFALFQIPKIF